MIRLRLFSKRIVSQTVISDVSRDGDPSRDQIDESTGLRKDQRRRSGECGDAIGGICRLGKVRRQGFTNMTR